MTKTPQAVVEALSKLEPADRETVQSYIVDLEKKVYGESAVAEETEKTTPEKESTEQPTAEEKAVDETPVEDEPTEESSDEPEFPPIYASGEDYDAAAAHKQEAADLKASGDWEKALEKYTAAILVAPPSALLYANRANALLKLGRPKAAERDASLALKENPDSAKALRMRGKARKVLEKWEEALQDLSASQTIDYDEGTVEDLKFLAEKHLEFEKKEAAERILQEEKKRKRAEEIRKAQEEARKAEAESKSMPGGMQGGFPGGMGGMPGGFPGGMPGGGMPGGIDMASMMGDLMSDPELLAAMQNPKVQTAMQEMMAGGAPDPAKMAKYMSDPEIGPIFGKLMEKFGGMGGPPPAASGGDNDDIPNLDEMDGDVDLDDLPDLD